MTTLRRALLAATALLFTSSGHAAADTSVADFFRDKTIRLLVGTTPGAGYDIIARLLAAHIGRRIPGQPKFVVENMPGAGSLTMVNFLYNRAARDGTAMGLPLNGVVLEPTLKLMSRAGGNANFDIDKMHWIGTPSDQPQVLWYKTSSNIATFADAQARKSIVGASSTAADNYIVARLTNYLLGAKLDIVSGYPGTNDIFLAAERGEVDGSATAYSAITASRPSWLPDNKIRIVLQYGAERLPALPDVPTAAEIAPDAESREMLRFFAVKFKAAYAFVLPPEVPAARVEAIRTAFDETMRDTDFIADMRKNAITLSPLGGVELTTLIRSTYAMPQASIARLQAAIGQ